MLTVKKALQAKLATLKKTRETIGREMKVRQGKKVPRCMAEARTRPDFKDWPEAHDAELDKHDTELRIWVYEGPPSSDRPVPFTMTYKAKKKLSLAGLTSTNQEVPFQATS